MTIFGWDASNYDSPPTVRDGIDFYTHKAGEGHHMYYDREYGASLNNARSLGIPILGAYFVNHPGSVNDQVDWFVSILDQDTPWWRTHPCFILQIDAEKFDYMLSAPTKAEIQAFGDRLVNVHGVMHSRVIAYAPQWLYGNTLSGLTYKLWASAYGGNPVGHYLAVYPGDNDVKRWQSYSGQAPFFLQYGSNATIANQTTSDANAYRDTLDQLMSALGASSITPTPLEEGEEMIAWLGQDRTGMAIVWIDGSNIWFRGMPNGSSEMRATWAAAGVKTFGTDNYPFDLDKLDPPLTFGDIASQYQDHNSSGGGGGTTNVVFPTYEIKATATPKE